MRKTLTPGMSCSFQKRPGPYPMWPLGRAGSGSVDLPREGERDYRNQDGLLPKLGRDCQSLRAFPGKNQGRVENNLVRLSSFIPMLKRAEGEGRQSRYSGKALRNKDWTGSRGGIFPRIYCVFTFCHSQTSGNPGATF